MIVCVVPFVAQKTHSLFIMPIVEFVSGDLTCIEQHVDFEIIEWACVHEIVNLS